MGFLLHFAFAVLTLYKEGWFGIAPAAAAASNPSSLKDAPTMIDHSDWSSATSATVSTGQASTSIFGADYVIYPALSREQANHNQEIYQWRRLNATAGDGTNDPELMVHRGAPCFESYECSWYYHTRYPGHFGDCEAGQCVCEPGYFGDHCEFAPPAPAFSCSSGTCYNAKINGRASEERGGNVTITVVSAKNLQDLDLSPSIV